MGLLRPVQVCNTRAFFTRAFSTQLMTLMRTVHVLTAALLAFATPLAAADLSKLKPWSGGTPPTFVLKDLDDKQHQLADYRGKVLVVNFWATWCAPCVEEMPSFERLAKRLSGEPFALLTVNFGEKPKRIKPFLEKIGVDVPVLVDPDMSVSRSWVKKGLPTTFIIDGDQNIRYQVLGELPWDAPEVEAKIRELLPNG
jgi:thiol-disulfide isomerase/thioredoxin